MTEAIIYDLQTHLTKLSVTAAKDLPLTVFSDTCRNLVKQVTSFSEFEIKQTTAKEFTDANKNQNPRYFSYRFYVPFTKIPSCIFQFYM